MLIDIHIIINVFVASKSIIIIIKIKINSCPKFLGKKFKLAFKKAQNMTIFSIS